jgi:NAD(P)-dependent dehydrogenase (short-subunit alcohol dehydrogenase family)
VKRLPYKLKELENKVAVVTGGATGIGLASARLLIERGAKVAILGNDQDALDAALSELKLLSKSTIAILCDVSSEESVENAFSIFDRSFDRLSILVSNAAIQPFGTVEDTSNALWNEIQGVNLTGSYLTARASIKRMKKFGGGSIINVTSVQGSATQKRVAAYSTSKGGLLALTRAIAVDHADDKIRCNSVSPGCIDAPMTKFSASKNTTPENERNLMEQWGRMQPLGRMGKATEVAEVIVFLASDRASFCTGADFKVDGGLMASLGVKLPD